MYGCHESESQLPSLGKLDVLVQWLGGIRGSEANVSAFAAEVGLKAVFHPRIGRHGLMLL